MVYFILVYYTVLKAKELKYTGEGGKGDGTGQKTADRDTEF